MDANPRSYVFSLNPGANRFAGLSRSGLPHPLGNMPTSRIKRKPSSAKGIASARLCAALSRRMAEPTSHRLLKFPEAMAIVGFRRIMIYRMIRQGTFPAPYEPGGSSSRWNAAEVTAWVAGIRAARK